MTTADTHRDADRTKKWQVQETELLEKIKKQMEWYGGITTRSHRAQRLLATTILICSTLSPLFIISSTNATPDFSVYGMSAPAMAQVALVLSLIVALSEGIRRIYRFEEQWKNSRLATEDLKTARDDYKDKQIGLKVGSQEWVAAFGDLRRKTREITTQNLQSFMETVKADTKDAET